MNNPPVPRPDFTPPVPKTEYTPIPTKGPLGIKEKATYERPSEKQPLLAFTKKDNLKKNQPNEGKSAVVGKPEAERNTSGFKDHREYEAIYHEVPSKFKEELFHKLAEDALKTCNVKNLRDAQELPSHFKKFSGIKQTDKPQVFYKSVGENSREILMAIRLNNGKPPTTLFMNAEHDETGKIKMQNTGKEYYFHLGTDKEYDKSKNLIKPQFYTLKGRWLRGEEDAAGIREICKDKQKESPKEYWAKQDIKITQGKGRQTSFEMVGNLEIIQEKKAEDAWTNYWEKKDEAKKKALARMEKAVFVQVIVFAKLAALENKIGNKIESTLPIIGKIRTKREAAIKRVEELKARGKQIPKDVLTWIIET